MSYSIIRGFTTLGCPKPSAVLWHEVVGTEHYQVDNGIIHRRAENVAIYIYLISKYIESLLGQEQY